MEWEDCQNFLLSYQNAPLIMQEVQKKTILIHYTEACELERDLQGRIYVVTLGVTNTEENLISWKEIYKVKIANIMI